MNEKSLGMLGKGVGAFKKEGGDFLMIYDDHRKYRVNSVITWPQSIFIGKSNLQPARYLILF